MATEIIREYESVFLLLQEIAFAGARTGHLPPRPLRFQVREEEKGYKKNLSKYVLYYFCTVQV